MHPRSLPRRLLAATTAALLVAACGSGTANTSPSQSSSAAASAKPCIASGDEVSINKQLVGSNAEAVLCPGAVFQLSTPVIFSASGQKVYTEGRPTDDTRATLILVNTVTTTAVNMIDTDSAQLTNVIVDGNRDKLGAKEGDALVLAGGVATEQVISDNIIRNTRSWSSLHLFEGGPSRCEKATVERNSIGPAGTSKEWADGISLACTNSLVRDNAIVDATDGAIVVFGAPGSIIEGNTIVAQTRTLLGGINMVDYAPYSGDYTGTIVRNNTIDAAAAVIRIGLGMGEHVWGCIPNDTTSIMRGGTVTGNVLKGSKMQYGFAVSGVTDWTVTDNRDESKHIGTPSNPCGDRVASKPKGFQRDPKRSSGTFQPEFTSANLELALWAIVKPKPGE